MQAAEYPFTQQEMFDGLLELDSFPYSFTNQDHSGHQCATIDDFDPLAYDFRVEYEPAKVRNILSELDMYGDERRFDFVRALEKGCTTITPDMLDAYLESDLLGLLFDILTRNTMSAYAFTSRAQDGKGKANKSIIEFACSLLRCVKYIIGALVVKTHMLRMEQIVPTSHQLCLILRRVVYVPKGSGRWDHDDWQSTHLQFRQAVDDLVGALFKLTIIESEDSRKLAKSLAVLVMRSWIRGYKRDLCYRPYIMTLVQRTFSQNIPLEKTAFRDGKRYEAIRKAFERDLSDRDIVGGERADVVEALMSCLEHHPKVANLEYTENLFPVLRTAIEREDEREKSKIASDEQFRALKWLAKAVRALLQGIPFCGRPGQDIRPSYKIPYWLYVIPPVLQRAAAREDKETFGDCCYILGLEGPQVIINHKEQMPTVYAAALKHWETIRAIIGQQMLFPGSKEEKEWRQKLSDSWVKVGKAYGFIQDDDDE